MFDKPTLEWIRRTGATVFRSGGAVFVVAAKYRDPEFLDLLRTFDSVLERSIILKDSPTTTAGLAAFSPDGQPVFLKRTNNKGLRFTLRYLFRPARAFRSARAASDLEELGLTTPVVLAAGERRTGPVLRGGYLVTASSDRVRGMEKIAAEVENPPEMLDSFFSYAASAMAKIHGAGIIHGDLKISNFYCDGTWSPNEARYGIWDLDSIRRYPAGVPRRLIEKELGRLIASCLMTLDGDPRTPDSFFSPLRLARRLAELYVRNPGIPLQPDAESVAGFARERWNRMPDRRRKEIDAE